MRNRIPFLAMNRLVNPALKALLRSPFHRLASGRLALLTYRGRRTAREHTIPCFYRDEGDEVTIAVGWPDRKVWWRNLTGEGGTVRLLLHGEEVRGHAVATRDPGRDALVRVRVGARSRRRRRAGRTPPFRGPDGAVLSGSIADVGYRRLGGLDQWVLIRGESVENPPLILLHGGPGMSETGFFRHFNAPLERNFTVVYWDQRGTGKSFDPGIPRSSMTLERFLSDLDELVDLVRERLGKTKVAIFGHSWGSLLGVLYAARFPEKVSVYAGSGQIGDSQAAEAASYAFALAEAERRGKGRAVKKLREIGPPPYSVDALLTERTTLARLEGRMRPRAMWKIGRAILGPKESSVLDLRRALRGFRFSLDAMWDSASRLDLNELAPELRVPVFFLLGRRDHWVPPETSVTYFEALRAPSKELVWFEDSGHEPFVDEPERFNAAMADLVRPVLDEPA